MKHKFNILHFETLPSSNDYAKNHRDGINTPAVIWCDQQTNGRGRFKRVWESNRDLTFSMLFHDDAPHHLLAPLSLICALSENDFDCKIKWPNDILYEGKKLCGILIEKVYEGNEKPYTIVGIGVNTTPPCESLSHKATWVPLPSSSLLSTILQRYEALQRLSLQELLKLYRSCNYLKGRKILQNGVLWDVSDISEEGYLLVCHDDVSATWKSEEVTLEHIY